MVVVVIKDIIVIGLIVKVWLVLNMEYSMIGIIEV